MPVLTQVFVEETVVGIGDIIDINGSTAYGTIDSIPIVGGTYAIGGFRPGIVLSAEDECFFPNSNTPGTTPTTLPTNADPPFPPVWPYLFSTNDIYGRDNLNVDLKMIRGDTFVFDIAVVLNGAAVDITSGLLRMTAKWAVTDADIVAVFQLSSPASGIVITNATGGLATVTIPPADTVGLPAYTTTLAYDIQLEFSATEIYTVLRGNLIVFPDVTLTT